MIKIRKKGFTLVELMVSMAIFAILLTSLLSVVHNIFLARIKSMNRISLTEQLYQFSEDFFSAIKKGGILDYEEYWNRKIVGDAIKTGNEGGFYKTPTGIGNYGRGGNIDGSGFGERFYYCLSEDGNSYNINDTAKKDEIEENGCIKNFYNSGNEDFSNQYQRYGQYNLQFWDYNGNYDDDMGDEDGKLNGNIFNFIGDEDDIHRWNGPLAFKDNIYELYLIDKKQNIRTFFRWKISQDPNAPIDKNTNTQRECKVKDENGIITAGEYCRGNIQVLKMEGQDWGLDHNGNTEDTSTYDGQIDTWICSTGWTCSGQETIGNNIKAATGKDEEWINLFPSSINVKSFRIQAFPRKDPWLAVEDKDCQANEPNCHSPFIHPYIRISLELGFSHGKRRTIRAEDPTISISTMISLDDFH